MNQTSKSNYFTMTLIMVYDDNSSASQQAITKLIGDKYPLVELVCLHENVLKDRKKAFKIKGGYSARKNPFAILLDMDKNPIKAFYSEANECTVDAIEKILDSFIISKN